MSLDTTSLASWLARSAAGGGLVLLLVWGLTALTRQPARRQRLGECGVCAALLVAFLSGRPAWIPLRVGFLPTLFPNVGAAAAETDVTYTEAVALAAVGDGGEDFVEPDEKATAELLPVPGLAADLPSPEVADPEATSRGAKAATPTPTFFGAAELSILASLVRVDALIYVLVAAYLFGGALLLGRWLCGWLALWRFLRDCRPAPADAAAVFAGMTRGWCRPPRLLVSRHLRTPVSCGLWRSAVVVPASFCVPANRARLRWVFAHELTHLERLDPWSCLLFGLGQAVYFYLPWFWWLRRQARLCREYVADAAAARQAGEAVDYAQFLVSLAEAPAGPRVAIGVLGGSSDLFRRITMLLQNPLRVENRCPWRWSLATAAGLLTVAVCAAGVGLRAEDPEKKAGNEERRIIRVQVEPEKKEGAQGAPVRRYVRVLDEEPKKEEPKKDGRQRHRITVRVGDKEVLNLTTDDVDLDSIRKALEDLPKNEDIDRIKGELLKKLEKMKADGAKLKADAAKAKDETLKQALRAKEEALQQAKRWAVVAGQDNPQFNFVFHQGGRLGVTVGPVASALRDQLDLPKNEGQVVLQVQPDSPAAKAGLKVHDILLTLDGKAVAGDPAAFHKLVNEIKSDTPVDAVVMRKGRKEKVRDITLKEAKDTPFGVQPRLHALPGAPAAGALPVVPPTPAQPGIPPMPRFQGAFGGAGGAAGFGGPNTVMTSVFRDNDRFTGRHQEGSLVLTVTGTVNDGKAKVNEIRVQDGRESEKYSSLDKVPERYKDKVKSLIDMSAKNSVKVEVHSGSPSKP